MRRPLPTIVSIAIGMAFAATADWPAVANAETRTEQAESAQQQTPGNFTAGLGVEIIMDKDGAKVVAPLDDSAAAKAGLKTKDVITHIDHVPLQGLRRDQVIGKMVGAPDTTVRLTIVRAGQAKPIDVTIMRETVRVQPLRLRQDGDIGYIRLALLDEQAMAALTKAVEELRRVPADTPRGYVLDLRNTASGVFDVAVSVADAFLETGEIVSVRGRNPAQVERFTARPGDILDGKPLVVLINGGSAAGAEIVAGALQDHKRAVVIGSRSFGSGLVQTIVPLGEGQGALQLTTGRYFTPAGRSFDGAGLAPDVEVSQDDLGKPEDDRALGAAYNRLRRAAPKAASPAKPK